MYIVGFYDLLSWFDGDKKPVYKPFGMCQVIVILKTYSYGI
ncbi:hypothetical protein KNP414_01801 [Paenibacillus mucilaginosus KNP414]|uniref:Uncharacterized protein n=1 Tax=Paenibacillus mucilaginosus (strain KNP414) TaxID=1036673 RepID=F8FQK8_PAEMK|nr:hypothetical protein KNP414_01801 [Paenibacillus mucilaginosus KNP414]